MFSTPLIPASITSTTPQVHSASRTGCQRSTRSSFILPHGPVARGPRDLPSFCFTDRLPEVLGIFLHSASRTGGKRSTGSSFTLPHGLVARGPRDLPSFCLTDRWLEVHRIFLHSALRTCGQRSTGSSTGSTRSSFILPHGPLARGPRDLPSFCKRSKTNRPCPPPSSSSTSVRILTNRRKDSESPLLSACFVKFLHSLTDSGEPAELSPFTLVGVASK